MDAVGVDLLPVVIVSFIRSSLTDDLVDWNSGVSVRPYVHRKFFRFPFNFVCG